MDKKEKLELSERDIEDIFITPALKETGWDRVTQIRQNVTLTPGPIIVRGNMSSRNKKKKKFADYVLYKDKGIHVAVVEAKENSYSVSHGMQQALEYAEILEVPSAFSSNGDAFASHNKVPLDGEDIETEFSLNDFPGPEELWKRYKKYKGIEDEHEELVTEPYHVDTSGKEPRYYQSDAINNTIEAIAKGQNRILLVMATGTGKTYTTFQIIWRLWKSKRAKRILFLADRNILVDQTIVNDFKPFRDKMTKIKNRKIDPAYEIHLGLYQAITGPDEEDKIFKNVKKDFFDLIVIDECHRGSASDDSSWREILDYFDEAVQIGLTATPKETKYVSNITYFGEPVYTYSLKQGIADGFLAPYKIVKVNIDKDMEGYTPPPGAVDDLGKPVEEGESFSQSDMDRKLILNQRTRLVAKRTMDLLKATDPFSKTIIFCEDIDHAERMRKAIVNEAGQLAIDNPKYVMRITGDSVEGKAELDNFIDPESRFPVIATTSEMLTTGVDAKTCKLIVLDKTISSMTIFKQIVGRGTRVEEDFGKYFFTILDFKNATANFFDPDFDGDPVVIYEPGPDDPPEPPDPEPGDDDDDGDDGGGNPDDGKYRFKGVEVKIQSEQVQYRDPDGKWVTESYKDFTKKVVTSEYSSLDDFLQKWNSVDQKNVIIDELEAQGICYKNLVEELGKGSDYSIFDLILHLVYDEPPLTKKERVNKVKKKNYFTKYKKEAQFVLNALLDKYADADIAAVENAKVLKLDPFNSIGTPVEIINDIFGGKDLYVQAIKELEQAIYEREVA